MADDLVLNLRIIRISQDLPDFALRPLIRPRLNHDGNHHNHSILNLLGLLIDESNRVAVAFVQGSHVNALTIAKELAHDGLSPPRDNGKNLPFQRTQSLSFSRTAGRNETHLHRVPINSAPHFVWGNEDILFQWGFFRNDKAVAIRMSDKAPGDGLCWFFSCHFLQVGRSKRTSITSSPTCGKFNCRSLDIGLK